MIVGVARLIGSDHALAQAGDDFRPLGTHIARGFRLEPFLHIEREIELELHVFHGCLQTRVINGHKMSVAQGQKMSIMRPMKDKDSQLVQFKLMLPVRLKARVEQEAINNRRSLSQEIVAALEEKFPPPRDEQWSFEEIYLLMDHIQEAETEAQEEARLSEVNDRLAAAGQPLRLRFAIDMNGDRVLTMTNILK